MTLPKSIVKADFVITKIETPYHLLTENNRLLLKFQSLKILINRQVLAPSLCRGARPGNKVVSYIVELASTYRVTN